MLSATERFPTMIGQVYEMKGFNFCVSTELQQMVFKFRYQQEVAEVYSLNTKEEVSELAHSVQQVYAVRMLCLELGKIDRLMTQRKYRNPPRDKGTVRSSIASVE
jgi:hypothetical protein